MIGIKDDPTMRSQCEEAHHAFIATTWVRLMHFYVVLTSNLQLSYKESLFGRKYGGGVEYVPHYEPNLGPGSTSFTL